MIPQNCTDIDEFVDGYIKANGLDNPALAGQADMIKTLLLSGALGGIALLSNRIAKDAIQGPAVDQLANVSQNIASLTTELLIRVEKDVSNTVGTA